MSLPPLSQQVTDTRYAFFNFGVSEKRDVNVLVAGRETCLRRYRVERGNFPSFGLELVVGGRGILTIGGSELELFPGMVFVYGGPVHHRIETDDQLPMTKWFVDFEGGAAKALLERGNLRPGTALFVHDFRSLQALFEQLVSEGHPGDGVTSDIAKALLKALLLKATRSCSPPEKQPQAALASYERARRLIDENFCELNDLAMISRRAGIDRAYLCRLFQRFHGQSPYRYLIARKMARAAEVLVGEAQTVAETADLVGFSDPYHFSKSFKRHFGYSPTAFRDRAARNSRSVDSVEARAPSSGGP